jgi:hypothetical protein
MPRGKGLSIFLTPFGAAVVVICFFLPWVEFSCVGVRRTMSGAQLGGVFWLVSIAAAVALGAFVYCFSRGQARRSWPVAALTSLAALALIVYKYLSLWRGEETPYGTITPEDVGLTIQPGAVGTVLGLLLVLVGVPFLRRPGRGGPQPGGSGEMAEPPAQQQEGPLQ